VPLLNDRAQLVASERHAVEVSQAVAAFNFLTNQTELAEVSGLVVQIAERDLVDASLQEVACNACNQSLSL
jgi:hypothetical protein